MIKGVNKRIIEVLNPDDEYFEKIIFFINPNSKGDQSLLSQKTRDYVSGLEQKVKNKKSMGKKLIFAGELLSAATVGGLAVALALTLL